MDGIPERKDYLIGDLQHKFLTKGQNAHLLFWWICEIVD
jgi:hypothetical protein